MSSADLATLALRIGLAPSSVTLDEALTHSSYAAEHDCASNERLEFLGDAVIDLAVADFIVATYPGLNEGSASIVRAQVVNEAALADAARSVGLGAVLKVGRGVERENGTERASLLADAFEAVVAALYLEVGFDQAKTFVLDVLANAIASAAQAGTTLDPKTRLRQWSEQQGLDLPGYDVVPQGPPHDITFVATVRVGDVVALGSGPSKKRAETAAAEAAWKDIDA